MSDSDTLPPGDEAAARSFCLKLLKEDAETSYKEARREARTEGLKITRAVFSSVQRELGNRRDRRTGGPGEGRRGPRPDAPPRSAPRPAGPPQDRGRDRPRDDRPRHDRPRDERPRNPAPRPDRPRDDRPRDDRPRPDRAPPGRPRPSAPDDRPFNPLGAPSPQEPPLTVADLFPDAPNALVAPQRIDSAPSTPETLFGATKAFTEPKHAGQTPVEFMTDHLRDFPETSFRDMKELAESKGFTIYPATFGRAQGIAGLLDDDEVPEEPVKPKAAAKRAARPTPNAKDPASVLENLVSTYEEAAGERDALKGALEKMLAVVQKALSAPQVPPLESPKPPK